MSEHTHYVVAFVAADEQERHAIICPRLVEPVDRAAAADELGREPLEDELHGDRLRVIEHTCRRLARISSFGELSTVEVVGELDASQGR